MSSELTQAITHYAAAMDVPLWGDDPQAIVLERLVARDRVAQVLAGDPPPPDADAANVRRLIDLDARLKAEAKTIDVVAGWGAPLVGPERKTRLATWRDTVQPPEGAWWWFPDERVAALGRLRAFATGLAWLFLLLALSLAFETVRRFLSGGADFLSAFTSVAQFVLALAAGRALVGRQALERWLLGRGARPRHLPLWTAGLALGVLLSVGLLRLSLPAVARYYNRTGVALQDRGDRLTSAISSYQRAISLHPDYAEAHYNLATAYEEMLEYDAAATEYRTALSSSLEDRGPAARRNPTRAFAYNNLAHLAMLRDEHYSNALELLNEAFARVPDLDRTLQPGVAYTLYKNRGWAKFGLGSYLAAEEDLVRALERNPDGLAALCLLAQALEKQKGREAEAQAVWETIADHTRAGERKYVPGDYVKTEWLVLAQERAAQYKSRRGAP